MCLSLPHPWFAFFFLPFLSGDPLYPPSRLWFLPGAQALLALSAVPWALRQPGCGGAVWVCMWVWSLVLVWSRHWNSCWVISNNCGVLHCSLFHLLLQKYVIIVSGNSDFFFPQKHLCSSPPVELFLWHHVCILQRWSEVYSFLLSPYFAFHP